MNGERQLWHAQQPHWSRVLISARHLFPLPPPRRPVSQPTYENSFVKVVQHRGQEIECLIKDTQGVGEQEVFRNEYGLGVHGYVLVYNIASARSFGIVQSVNDKLVNLIGTSRVPRVLIGNKFDLATSPSSAAAAAASSGAVASQALVRQVSVEQGQALADQWGCPFFECSAKGGMNIDRAFSTLLDEIDAINEPKHTRDVGRWWRSLLCCKWWRRRWASSGSASGSGDEEDGSIGGGHHDSLLSSSDLAQAVERHTNVCKLTVWAVMLLSLAGVIYGATLAIHTGPDTGGDSQTQLTGYILSGLAMLVWLVSLIGLHALRATSGATEFLTVYACALAILVVAEIGVWVLLLLNIALVAAHAVAAALVGAVAVALQLASCVSAYKLARALGATAASASPYGDDYRATYHSLYE